MATKKVKVYIEQENGSLRLLFFPEQIIFIDNNHEGHLKDGRPLRMQIVDQKEVWYIPIKYQKGEY